MSDFHEQLSQAHYIEMSRATKPLGRCSYDLKKPEGLEYLDFQKAGIQYSLSQKSKITLFGDEPGLGKTIQSLGALNQLSIKNFLVLCPSSVVYNWKSEIEKWHIAKPIVEIYNPKTFSMSGQRDVLIFGYGYCSYLVHVQNLLNTFKYEACVVDEIHFIGGHESKRTKFVLARNGIAKRAKVIHAISGTPMTGQPIRLYPVLKTLFPKTIPDMDRFRFGMKYCAGFQDHEGRFNFNGASNMTELGKKLRVNGMVRRKKIDVLKELPPIFENIVYLDPNEKAQTLIAQTKTLDAETVITNPRFSFAEKAIAEVRREFGELIVDQAAKYIDEKIESGCKKILVLAHHKAVIETLRNYFSLNKYNYRVIDGAKSTLERQVAVEDFQTKDEIEIMLMSVTTAIGITLTKANYAVFVEFSWVPTENEQARDRIHRIGQTQNVIVDYLVFKDSIAEKILQTNLKKKKAIKDLLA